MDHHADTFPHRQCVGGLLRLARTSRPDILYAVNQLGAHVANPNMTHVVAAKRVLRYLQGTKYMPLRFHKGVPGEFILQCYIDADWAGEPEQNDSPMRSLTSNFTYIHGVGPIYWGSSLQSTIARSTAEAQYKAIGSGGQIVSGFREFLFDIDFEQNSPTTIYNDNQASNAMVKAKVIGSTTRHIKIQYIRELVKNEEITVKYCPTEDMVADIFTKAEPRFVVLRDKMMNEDE